MTTYYLQKIIPAKRTSIPQVSTLPLTQKRDPNTQPRRAVLPYATLKRPLNNPPPPPFRAPSKLQLYDSTIVGSTFIPSFFVFPLTLETLVRSDACHRQQQHRLSGQGAASDAGNLEYDAQGNGRPHIHGEQPLLQSQVIQAFILQLFSSVCSCSTKC